MLDWRKRRETSDSSSTTTASWRGTAWRGAIAIVLVAAVLCSAVGWYWSREPAAFSVQQNAKAAIESSGRQMVTGVTTIETLKRVASTLLDKPGGYTSNDMFPPGLFMDNMPNWEFGVLTQVRDFSRSLRQDFARSQSQSAEDPDLSLAEPRFNSDNDSWALPASESEYREGIKFLDRYEARLTNPTQPSAQFYTRADNLNSWLGNVATRLGSMSQRLSASVGRVRLDAGNIDPETVQPGQAPRLREQNIETPWLQIDDVFYEARGQAWALSHLLRAIEVDFADVLAQKNATISVRQIIRELESAQDPLWSPMVLNGSGYGILANHSLVMANYLSRANAAVIDLRNLLSQG